MKIDGGEDQVKSGMGTFCSVLLLLVTTVYAYQKLVVFIGKTDIKIMLQTDDMHFDEMDRFTAKMGFNIAVAFTAYDSEQDWILDERYGELVVKSFSWGTGEDGKPYTTNKKLKTHICTEEDLALNGVTDNSLFFEPHSASKPFASFYRKKFLCVDPEDMYINGDFTSNSATQIRVYLTKCRNRPDCYSDAQINAFYRDKFLLLLMNQARFMQEQFGPDAIIKESRLFWQTVNT